MERKNLQVGTRGQGGDEQKFRQRPDPITYGQKFGRKCQKNSQQEEKRHWAIEKPKLDTARKL